MQTVAIIILLAAVIVSLVAFFKLRNELDVWQSRAVERSMMLDSAITDKRVLVKEKAEIEAERDKLSAENAELKAALVAVLTTQPAESAEPKPVEEVNPLLPPQDIPTNTFRCEPYMVEDEKKSTDTETVYKSAFSKNSEQAALQEDCFTDIETGIRYYFDTSDGSKWYCAALAGAYGIEIGHCYIFTLANGTELPVMLADFKHDISDPKPDDYGDDDINYDGEKCLNVIEFVVDMPTIPKAARDAGTMSALDKFGGLYGHGGNIADVKDAGRRWKA